MNRSARDVSLRIFRQFASFFSLGLSPPPPFPCWYRSMLANIWCKNCVCNVWLAGTGRRGRGGCQAKSCTPLLPPPPFSLLLPLPTYSPSLYVLCSFSFMKPLPSAYRSSNSTNITEAEFLDMNQASVN
jgi:hypothetical protein